VEEPSDAPEIVVVDLSRILRADAGGARFIVSLAERIEARGGRLALTPGGGATGAALGALPGGVAAFADLDLALEWCEDELLARAGEQPAALDVPIADHELLAGLTPAELARVELELGSVIGDPGTVLVRQGEPATEVFLVTRGTLSVVRDSADGRSLRLTTLSAGGTFGELAFVDRGVRAADVRADSEVACRTLRYAAIDALATSDPALHGKLLRNLLGVVSATLHGVNAEIAHLTR
jgi:glutaminase